MRRTNIYLEERQAAALEERARAEGVSRAELIRRLLGQALAGASDDLAADLDALDASFGVAADDPPPPKRGQDARARHLDTMWRS